jgi:hypothetical protein
MEVGYKGEKVAEESDFSVGVSFLFLWHLALRDSVSLYSKVLSVSTMGRQAHLNIEMK